MMFNITNWPSRKLFSESTVNNTIYLNYDKVTLLLLPTTLHQIYRTNECNCLIHTAILKYLKFIINPSFIHLFIHVQVFGCKL